MDRYCINQGHRHLVISEAPHGRWVLYSDVEQLEATNKAQADALEHIADVASRGRSKSRRDVWIQSRAESAINGDDEWKDAPKPKNPTNSLLRQRAVIKAQADEIYALKAKIDALMLEYCPEDTTKKQMAEYELHQEIASNPESK